MLNRLLFAFVFGFLAVLFFGKINGVILVIVASVGWFLYLRRRTRRVSTFKILRALELVGNGSLLVYPGVDCIISESLIPKRQQWQFVSGLADGGLIKLTNYGEPSLRHVPPDVAGVVMAITSAGQEWLARYKSGLRRAPARSPH